MAALRKSRVEQVAKRFFGMVLPYDTFDYSGSPAKGLIVAAFDLYSRAWGPDYDIRRWEYPFDVLREGESFSSDEPWTVLLRRAVEITREGGER